MYEPGLLAKIVFALLLAASLGGFLWRLWPILGRIRDSKPEPGYALTNLPHRFWLFFWEVLLQSKVIAQRPLPGIAHALVFWGFLAFSLVTLDHAARGFGVPFLSHGARFSRFYLGFAALFAVATAIGITGLFIRRFVVRPKWLGEKVSIESGFIAGLIFTLMLTYLVDWSMDGHSGAINWWTHTLALLIFLPLIPHTKHLHLVLSPVAILAKREGFSHIPPLEGDEDFGLVSGKDITQVSALQAYSCVECGRCTEHCPAANTGKELNPKQIVLGLRSFLNENGAQSEVPLFGAHLSQKAVFQCTTCGACEFQCPVGIEHLPLLIGLRRGATNTGSWEDDQGAKLFRNLEKNGNPLGLPASDRDKFITRAALPIFDGTQEYCLWLGCMGSMDARGREIVEALTRVMRHLNTTFGVLKKERCTGDPARRLGNDLAFGELAGQNLKTMEPFRAEGKRFKLISICPHCVRTIREDWKEFGPTPEIEHHSQFLARYEYLLPPAPEKDTVVFHDPCYLGRYQNIYEEPRKVAAASASQLLEAPRNHERSFCCGAGGGLAFLGEEEGTRVNETRAKELAETGAKTIGTGCPFCQTMFQAALTQISMPTPALKDIAELAAARLPVVN
ncbi:heterodisulfide reductase-related iron-sulfur binding cluster [Bryobacter aggregatus]|uniref:heterodisulfide reductase-related iron-sulfur binding cluster n=1 Tax=Bryobacter aggregatus TaxID=360054 RepID=UPI0004E18355|nr:heterodisulfide reductase-related iron-sulfur binding cluster [Bryobacter aggregatus]